MLALLLALTLGQAAGQDTTETPQAPSTAPAASQAEAAAVIGPLEVGSAIFTAGVCSGLGWEVESAEGERLKAAVAGAHPELTAEAFQEQALAGSDATRFSLSQSMQQVSDLASHQAFTDMLERRCNGLSAAFPTLVRRGPETEATWARIKQQTGARFQQ